MFYLGFFFLFVGVCFRFGGDVVFCLVSLCCSGGFCGCVFFAEFFRVCRIFFVWFVWGFFVFGGLVFVWLLDLEVIVFVFFLFVLLFLFIEEMHFSLRRNETSCIPLLPQRKSTGLKDATYSAIIVGHFKGFYYF